MHGVRQTLPLRARREADITSACTPCSRHYLCVHGECSVQPVPGGVYGVQQQADCPHHGAHAACSLGPVCTARRAKPRVSVFFQHPQHVFSCVTRYRHGTSRDKTTIDTPQHSTSRITELQTSSVMGHTTSSIRGTSCNIIATFVARHNMLYITSSHAPHVATRHNTSDLMYRHTSLVMCRTPYDVIRHKVTYYKSRITFTGQAFHYLHITLITSPEGAHHMSKCGTVSHDIQGAHHHISKYSTAAHDIQGAPHHISKYITSSHDIQGAPRHSYITTSLFN